MANENDWLDDVHTGLRKAQKVFRERADYLLENDLRFHEDVELGDAFSIIEAASLVLDLEERGETSDAKACWEVHKISWEQVSAMRGYAKRVMDELIQAHPLRVDGA